MLNQVSIRSPSISTNLNTLFDYSGRSSQTVVLYPEIEMEPHVGHLKQYCRNDTSTVILAELLSESYRSEAITARSFRDATVFQRLGVVRHGNGPIVKETTNAIRHQFKDWIKQLNSTEFLQLPESYIPGNYIYAMHGNYPVYSHVIFETICTAYILKDLLINGQASLVVPDHGQTWYSQLLDLMQIPKSSRYRLGATARFENLIMSSTCEAGSTFKPSSVMRSVSDFLKSRAGVSNTEFGTERLYLTRRGFSNTSRRDYAEEDALYQMLSEFGFRSLNPATMTICEQINLFSRAQIVVGVHSSAFANLIFSPDGCLVIDILPNHWANVGGMFTKNITNLFNQKYIYMIAESSEIDGGYECTMDPKLIFDVVKEILKE